jgi:hypothetical protein
MIYVKGKRSIAHWFMFYLCFVFIYVYWCPTRCPYQMMLVLFNIYTTSVTSATRPLSFLCHRQDFYLSTVTDKTFIFPVTDKTFIFPLSPTRLLSFLCHRQDFYLSCVTDNTFIFPVSPTNNFAGKTTCSLSYPGAGLR